MSDCANCKATEAKLQAERDSLLERFLSWRGIELGDECGKCMGAGVRAYPSSATWRGGVGGQTITSGICDGCWGTGNSKRPGIDLRKLTVVLE